MQYEKGFEGLNCVLQTEVVLKDERQGWKFRCSCDLETLHLDRDLLRQELAERWHQITDFHRFAEQWNGSLSSAKDFCDYQKQILTLRARRRRKESPESMGLLGGLDSSFVLKCTKCRRSYRFQVRLESPLSFVPEMDLLECFEKLGLNMDNNETKPLLEREALAQGFSNRNELSKHLETLKNNKTEIGMFLNELAEVAKKHADNMQGELSRALVKATAESVEDIRRTALKENEAELRRILNSIASRCEELLFVPVEVP